MLTPFTQVVLAVPPNPPVPRTLGDVAAGRRTGAIPPTAMVQLAPDGPWIPVDEVLAQARLGGPTSTSTRGLLAALVTVPPVVAFVFYLALGAGAGYLLALWGLGFALVLAAKADPRRETMSSGELLKLVTQKPALWYGTLLVASGLVALAIWSAVGLALEKGRAAAAFNETDDCEFADKWWRVSDDGRASVSEDLKERARSRVDGCDKARAQAEASTYAKTCSAVAERMAKKALTPEDLEHIRKRPAALGEEYFTGDDAVKLAERVAGRSLEADDLTSLKKLPCGPSARRAFLSAAGSSTSAWTSLSTASRVDEDLLHGLGGPGRDGAQASKAEVEPSAEVRAVVHKKAEEIAGKNQNVRSSEDAKPAVDYCTLDRRLGSKAGPSCTALFATVKRLKDAENVRLAALEARCKAASAARQKCMRACDAKQPQDDLGMPAGDFDDSLACYERCEKANPASGCE